MGIKNSTFPKKNSCFHKYLKIHFNDEHIARKWRNLQVVYKKTLWRKIQNQIRRIFLYLQYPPSQEFVTNFLENILEQDTEGFSQQLEAMFKKKVKMVKNKQGLTL